MKKFVHLLANVWHLAKGYWSSEERWSARGLLLVLIALNLGSVYIHVVLNGIYGDMYNALQAKDRSGFYAAFGNFMGVALIHLAVFFVQYYLNRILQLRWRRWLTDLYLTRWLANHSFYRMRFGGRVDNPDQRISEDVNQFIAQTLGLGLDLMNSIVTLVSFSGILWGLSGGLTVPLGDYSFTIPGYMFWAAVLYSGTASIIAHLVGRPLISLNNRQQRVEADFRFALVRLREEGEGIALYHGEAQERANALARFGALLSNLRRLIVRGTIYSTYDNFIAQLAIFFPFLVAVPRYLAGDIQLGGLMQTSRAFGQVNGALSWFIGSYAAFAQWRATVDRLLEFTEELDRLAETAELGVVRSTTNEETIDFDDVAVGLPDTTPLVAPTTLKLKPHEPVLLQGSSGAGKSTIFRLLAGLWPFASGRLRIPRAATSLFLPQRPYMPIGTLRQALWFPAEVAADRDDTARDALAAVSLAAYGNRLDESAHWSQVLSPGEQQRLAIARALLTKPDWLFLDEATSAIDEDQEEALYHTITAALPQATIVSIGHRRSLEAYHRRHLRLERQPGSPGRLVEEPAIVTT
jgi:putative ATP-binding cassette transporter